MLPAQMQTANRHAGACALALTLTGAAGYFVENPLAQVPASLPGTATVSLTADGVSMSGDYPTSICAGPYMVGRGLSYQVRAGEWRITVASETRAAGKLPMNTPDGGVNVTVVVNGPGKHFVRAPRSPGTFDVAADFRNAEGTFTLRNAVGRDTAKLAVTFTCGASEAP